MTVASVILRIETLGYWLQATGRGGGADYDLVADRDSCGLPLLRGRHLRGLLRDAARQALALEWPKAPDPDLLFGARPAPGSGETAIPGCVTVDDARLPATVIETLRDKPAYRDGFYRRIASTAINARGVAKQHTLRTVEAAIPCVLLARLSWAPQTRLVVAGGADEIQAAETGWAAAIDSCLPLIRSVGAGRSRGLGRARLSLLREGGS